MSGENITETLINEAKSKIREEKDKIDFLEGKDDNLHK